jgi:adenine-specific DNA glycosylase
VKQGKPLALRISVRLALVEKHGAVLMRQRPPEESLMPGFWEFPAPENLATWHEESLLGSFRHTITHHHYTVTVLHGTISGSPAGFEWRRSDALEAIPLTTISKKALRLLFASRTDTCGHLTAKTGSPL